MLDMLQQLLGIDFSAFHVSTDIQYMTLFLFVLFLAGEVFNIIRSVISYCFRR